MKKEWHLKETLIIILLILLLAYSIGYSMLLKDSGNVKQNRNYMDDMIVEVATSTPECSVCINYKLNDKYMPFNNFEPYNQ